jgi:hypothetical protein
MHDVIRFAIGVLRLFGIRPARRGQVVVAMPPHAR